ncbi:helix-turn-helix domain-containing protein [Streptomyces acidiscabies]|uniref:Helix-turn-helix transcriptional regulator n=1 Tax=Streptomyces acidiscabies TaxID=42234 RepID=A0AAP6EKA5_9ACTN|nr:helix-turn-helix transcriptional regulator [Streptomyces acidiscabies]MBP5938648.1 helix-turn-helix domain-containing protein [Streptomyces sp. LBUM 1476]MBZ3909749.1 helix-turn-helix transcriptional regulator [Streptomyces acidiscabies]MDX2965778.1 helix-turn-helix transcriptional regulator [Streptomyces acidiscabies]MDX3025260.1 helix-turn-helix transcriptional regulator [Streptomyces acidiscabies]MDX3795614.1 helix-turn-helix transcriptional regulator [Streptomyces acidiscabies]
MPSASDPSLNRRKLRLALKAARDKTGLTQREAADRLDWSLSKVIRIEAGTVSLSVTDLQAMLRLYEVDDEAVVGDLEQAARGSKGQSWWSDYSDIITPTFAQYLGYESAAHTIRAYHPTFFIGLLQTVDYIEAIFAALPSVTQAQRLTDLRTARQERVFADGGPALAMIVDEAAVRRLIGGASTMRNQLTHVKRLAETGKITLQILPFSAGAHASLEDSFILFGYHDDEDVLYLAGTSGVLTNRDDRAKVALYQECFEDLTDKALSQEASIALIDEVLGQLNLS